MCVQTNGTRCGKISEITDKWVDFPFQQLLFLMRASLHSRTRNKGKPESSTTLTMHQRSFMNKIWTQQAARRTHFQCCHKNLRAERTNVHTFPNIVVWLQGEM